MKCYIIYDKNGKIIRAGSCPDSMFLLQVHNDEFIMEGTADNITQKIVDGKIVNKTSEEIKADNPPLPEIPKSKRPIMITNEQYQSILDRLNKLEIRSTKNDE